MEAKLFIDGIKKHFPDATFCLETIDPEALSWRLEITIGECCVDLTWGPAMGLRGIDVTNELGTAVFWPLDSVDDAIDFISKVLIQ